MKVKLPDVLSFGADVTAGDNVADEIVIVPFAAVVTVVLVDVVTEVDSATLLCGSSTFGIDLSSFVIFAVLFVRMVVGAALYESDVMAANGFGGG